MTFSHWYRYFYRLAANLKRRGEVVPSSTAGVPFWRAPSGRVPSRPSLGPSPFDAGHACLPEAGGVLAHNGDKPTAEENIHDGGRKKKR